MSPEAKLSGATRVAVIARISKSGSAMPQPGDLQGVVSAVAVGARDLKIDIDQEVTK
jgi:cytochrome c-type biogenesis protein CcmH